MTVLSCGNCHIFLKALVYKEGHHAMPSYRHFLGFLEIGLGFLKFSMNDFCSKMIEFAENFIICAA